MPQALMMILGAVGAAIVAKLVAREWQRVNVELDRARASPAQAGGREGMPSLRRDPKTGIYHPTSRT